MHFHTDITALLEIGDDFSIKAMCFAWGLRLQDRQKPDCEAWKQQNSVLKPCERLSTSDKR